MPRKTKNLSQDRSQWSFGDAVFWHAFVFGTRPTGNPDGPIGRLWRPKDIIDELGITPHSFWNWVEDKSQPYDTVAIERVLFGDSSVYDNWRIEIQRLLLKTRANAAEAKAAKKRVNPKATILEPETGRYLIPYEVEMDEVADDPPQTDSEKIGKDDAEDGFRGGLPDIPAVQAYRKRSDRKHRRMIGAAVPVALAAILGLYAAVRPTPEVPIPPPKQATSAPKQPEPPSQPQKKAEVQPPVIAPPPEPVPQRPTEDEMRAQEERRITEQTIEARKLAFDNEKRQREQQAALLDQQEQSAARARRDRDWNGRTVAGIGYSLWENTGVAGQSIGYVMTETVADCAVACLKDDCDAFAFRREDNAPAQRKRYCYRFKKPFQFSANEFYTSGKRSADAQAKPTSANAETPSAPTIQLAQAKPVDASADSGVIECANGPVKVTGFDLSCDRILAGGTTLGSAQLSYTVANINECASKCRPIARCIGFTFNSAGTPGRQSCIIFGPTPESRSRRGWISGQR